jgi:hypothetical protein
VKVTAAVALAVPFGVATMLDEGNSGQLVAAAATAAARGQKSIRAIRLVTECFLDLP